MKRLIVLLLLALPALGVTVPCTPSVNGIYLVPPRPASTEPVLLRVGTRVPGKATFGDPTIEYLSFKRIIVTLPVSRMPYDVPDIETCDVQVLPVPEPLRPGVVYSVSVDYGGSGRYREIAVLPPLAAGTYLVTATVRRFMGFGWLRSYNRTQSMLTVVADAPRRRPSRH